MIRAWYCADPGIVLLVVHSNQDNAEVWAQSHRYWS